MLKKETEKGYTGDRSIVSSQDTEEKDVGHEVEPGSSSTINKVRTTGMTKPIKLMAAGCFIYDVEFKALVEEHQPDLRKVLRRKAVLFLGRTFHNVHTNQEDERSMFDVLSS